MLCPFEVMHSQRGRMLNVRFRGGSGRPVVPGMGAKQPGRVPAESGQKRKGGFGVFGSDNQTLCGPVSTLQR
jgi:hypothetical protein